MHTHIAHYEAVIYNNTVVSLSNDLLTGFSYLDLGQLSIAVRYVFRKNDNRTSKREANGFVESFFRQTPNGDDLSL